MKIKNLISKININNLKKTHPVKIKTKYLAALFILLLSYLIFSAYVYSENISKDLSKNVIRLHVIANSNSHDDQSIKYKVRDQILKYMESKMGDIKNTDEAKKFVRSNLGNIEKIAKSVLHSYGYDYSAKAYFGEFPFPTKVYGDVAFPAGEYQALRVVLGSGSGRNWWCVMFPPLCFVDASTGVLPDSSRQELKHSLTEEEYKLATSNSKGAGSDVKIKFKIVEILQQSKLLLAKNKTH